MYRINIQSASRNDLQEATSAVSNPAAAGICSHQYRRTRVREDGRPEPGTSNDRSPQEDDLRPECDGDVLGDVAHDVAKAEAARQNLLRFNPDVAIEAIVGRLTPQNVASLVGTADVVVDAADSFAATYILSDACRAAGKPLVSASAIGLSGYAGAFCGGGPSYRAVFPEAPGQAGNCASAGILGSVVAVLGGLQAHLVLHLLLNLKPSVLGRIVTFDAGRLAFGGFSFERSPEPAEFIPFIAASGVTGDDLVVDLRSLEEAPVSPFPHARRVGVEGVEAIGAGAAPSQRIVLSCRSGQRALQAASRLRRIGLSHIALVALGD